MSWSLIASHRHVSSRSMNGTSRAKLRYCINYLYSFRSPATLMALIISLVQKTSALSTSEVSLLIPHTYTAFILHALTNHSCCCSITQILTTMVSHELDQITLLQIKREREKRNMSTVTSEWPYLLASGLVGFSFMNKEIHTEYSGSPAMPLGP